MRPIRLLALLALLLTLAPPAWATINVKTDYGAECDGTDNDSGELTNALNAAASGGARQGEDVLVPGNCTLNLQSEVTIPNNVRLRGEHWSTSIIKRGADVNLLKTVDGINVTIENLGFDGNGTQRRHVLIGTRSAADVCGDLWRNFTRLKDLRMYGNPTTGTEVGYVMIDTPACQIVIDSVSMTNGIAGIIQKNPVSPTIILNSTFNLQANYPLYAQAPTGGGGCYAFAVYGGILISSNDAVRLDSGTCQLHIRGSYVEAMTRYAVYMVGDFTDLKLHDNYGLGKIHFSTGEYNDITVEGNTFGSQPIDIAGTPTFPSPYAYSWAGNIYQGTVPGATGSTAIPKEFVVSGNSHNQPGQQGVTVGATYGTVQTRSGSSWQTVASASFSHVHRAPHAVTFIVDLWCKQTAATVSGTIRLRAGASGSESDVGLNRPLSFYGVAGDWIPFTFIPNGLFSWNGGDLSVLVEVSLDAGTLQCQANSDSRFDALIAIRPE